MKSDQNWKKSYQKELDHALEARAKGNEGMARVCSRRAAGIAIGEYLARRSFSNLGTSIYDRYTIFNDLPEIDERTKEIANHFLLTVDTNHSLPQDIDLLQEVQWLAHHLLSETNN